MAVEFFIHKMSEHMAAAQIVKWHVGEGEQVEKFQVLIEVMTDKVAAEIESPAAGVIRGIRPGAIEGATVPVGEVICFIAEPGEVVATIPPLGLEATGGQPAPMSPSETPSRMPTVAAEGAFRGLRATPAARRVARELGIDITGVNGSGPHGSVTEADVRAYAAKRSQTGMCPSSNGEPR